MEYIGKRDPEEGFEKKTIALQVASACPPRPGLIYRFAKGQRLKTQGKVSRRHAWNNKSKLSELLFRDIYEEVIHSAYTPATKLHGNSISHVRASRNWINARKSGLEPDIYRAHKINRSFDTAHPSFPVSFFFILFFFSYVRW